MNSIIYLKKNSYQFLKNPKIEEGTFPNKFYEIVVIYIDTKNQIMPSCGGKKNYRPASFMNIDSKALNKTSCKPNPSTYRKNYIQ